MAPAKIYAIKLQIRDLSLKTIEEHLRLLKDTCSTMTMGELKARKDIAMSSFGDFKDAHKELLSRCQQPEEVNGCMTVCDRATSLHLEVMAQIEKATTAMQYADRHILPSINEIRLQKFDGELTDWVEWRTNFEKKLQKIDLLLDSLVGDAKNTAGKSERRGQDDLLWGKSVLHDDNPYEKVYAHIFTIISLPTIESPSTESFRNMIHVVEENLRLLGQYDVGSSSWGPLLCVMLLNKLDTHSRYLWNTSDRPSLPNLESLFKFLHQRSRALENEAQCKIASLSFTPNRSQLSAINIRLEPRKFNNNRPNNNSSIARKEEAKPYNRPCSKLLSH